MAIFFVLILIRLPMLSLSVHSNLPTQWSAFYELCRADPQPAGLPTCTNDDRELFAEVEQAESVLTEEMARNIPTPSSPAHPIFQKFYLQQQPIIDTQKISQSKENSIKHNSKPWNRVRTVLFGKNRLRIQADRVVKIYQKQVKSNSQRGVLLQNLYSDLFMAKYYGQVDPSKFRQNCQEVMALMTKEHPDMDLAQIVPFPNLLSLMRGSGRIFLTLFKQKCSSKSQKRTHTEDIFRILKTIVVDESIFNRNIGAKNDQKGRQRRRRRQWTLLLVLGMVLTVICIILFFIWQCCNSSSEERTNQLSRVWGD